MKNVQIKAERVLAGIVRDMLRADPECKAVSVVDAQGMRVEWFEDCSWQSRGWFFNHGGWSANRRNANDIRRWCCGCSDSTLSLFEEVRPDDDGISELDLIGGEA